MLKDKQQQLANVLEDKQKNLQSLYAQDEVQNSELDELTRKKQEVNTSFRSLCAQLVAKIPRN